MIEFEKYQGTGNDFVLIDDRKSLHNFSVDMIKRLCDRHFGIGADGIILLREHNHHDFEMLYYNADGLPGSMCGNGGRCAVAYAHKLGLIRNKASFSAFDGAHRAIIKSTDPYIVSLQMNDVSEIESNDGYFFLNTGSPHYVSFGNNVRSKDVVGEGRKIRYNKRFEKEGTNVNFVEPFNDDLFIRTYERGVEGETLSCGTGVTASVIAASAAGIISNNSCLVETLGGKLMVNFNKNGNTFSDIWLEGAADFVFSGKLL